MAIENYEPFVRHDLGAALIQYARSYEEKVASLEVQQRDGEPIPDDILDHARSGSSLVWEITRALLTDRLTINEEENN